MNMAFSIRRTLGTILLTLVTLVAACAAPSAATTPALASPTPPAVLPAATATPTASPTPPERDVASDDQGSAVTVQPDAPEAVLPALQASALTAAEVEGILTMREEEKLARDVYLTLYERWGIPILNNIARSEATHMDAVKTLIDRYGLEDPAVDEVGVFANDTLQALYDELVETGTQSLVDALRVGAAIEEIDILDLETHIAQTARADIRQVYENLIKGSRNHLRSFVGNLERRVGEAYEPQYLDRAAYEAIVLSAPERGKSGG